MNNNYRWEYPTKSGQRIVILIPDSLTNKELETVIKYTKLIKKFYKMERRTLVEKMVNILSIKLVTNTR